MMDSLTLRYDMLYTLLCNMHTLKALERRHCNHHRINVIVLLRYHETHYLATTMYSSHFRSYPLTACSMLVTYTTQPTHFRA